MPEERRIVTVMFADVTGSTMLGEALDPEDVRELMGRYFALAKDVIEQHGGTVEKFIGDEVMAVFGVPQAHGDDAERAIAAALALRSAVASDEHLARLRPRIGVNTGEVVSTSDISSGQFYVTGDAVNVAARIRQEAEPEQVLVGERTHRAAPRFAYDPPLDRHVKGKAGPVRAWPVVGHSEARSAITPFFGRETDLETLHLFARRAFTERRPYLVTVNAPPGTGKSRLVEEFVAQFRDRRGDVCVATAQCLPYGQTLAYWPLRGLLTQLLALASPLASDNVRARVAETLAADGERDAELITVTVSPQDHVEQRNRDEIFNAWRRLIERLGLNVPLLLVFEDLHWAADSLLDLIEYVTRPRTGIPLLVLSVARPELLERRPGWGSGRQNALTFTLDRLDDRYIDALVADLLGGGLADARRLIVERAEGSPFFALELARTIIDRGAASRPDDTVVADTLAALPDTVHATLLARLDLLELDERALLQAGAVIGRSFTAEVARLIANMDSVDAAIDALCRKDLIAQVDDSYVFRHQLIRDVAYQTLPRSRRAEAHAVVASHLARGAAERLDQLAGLIGLHYLAAARLRSALALAKPTGADELVRANAVRWLSRAARLGVATGASIEAVQQLRNAIAVATPDEELRLQQQLGDALAYGDEALAAYERAIELWRASAGDAPSGARLLGRYLASAEGLTGSFSPERAPSREAIERLNDEALSLARQSGEALDLGIVLAARAFFPTWSGDHSRDLLEGAQLDATKAVELFGAGRDRRWLSFALHAHTATSIAAGDLVTALSVAHRRVGVADELGEVYERIHARYMVSMCAASVGAFEEGLDAARAAAALPAEGTGLGFRLHALAWVANLSALTGVWDACVQAALAEFSVWREMGSPWAAYGLRGVAAAVYVARRSDRVEIARELEAFIAAHRLPADANARADVRYGIAANEALARDDPALAEAIVAELDRSTTEIPAGERALAVLAAHKVAPLSPARLDELTEFAGQHGLAPLTAQLLRLRWVQRGLVDDLVRALQLLRQLGLRHDAALAAADLAAATRDRALADEARRELERLGDAVGLRSVGAID